MSPHLDLAHIWRDNNIALAAGKWLFVHMGVGKEVGEGVIRVAFKD